MSQEILIHRVRSALDGRPVIAKRMFGGITFLLNGNMLCSVSGKGLMARVGAEAKPLALQRRHATPCLGAGRRMPGFILVDHDGVAGDADLIAWLELALAHVEQLPPKESKPLRGVQTRALSKATRG